MRPLKSSAHSTQPRHASEGRGSRLRWIAGGLVAAVAVPLAVVALTPAVASAATQQGAVDISFIDGSQTIHPGDWMSAGYAFTIPGAATDTVVGFDQAQVSIPVSCAGSGSTVAGTIVIPLGNPAAPFPSNPYSYTHTFSGWAPYQSNGLNGNESTYGAFQGAVQAPSLCGAGQPMYSDASVGSATFTAPTVQWSADANHGNGINVQFHYIDAAARGQANVNCASPTANPGIPASSGACNGASWSGTQTVVPTVNTDPLPVGALGGLALAGGVGVALYGVQRRRQRALLAKATRA